MGVMKPGLTTVVLSRGDSTLVFKKVPASVCDDCGEYFLDETTTSAVYERADRTFETGQEVSVASFVVV
jgi:YgiT-type zinc finger domain-containing protein